MSAAETATDKGAETTASSEKEKGLVIINTGHGKGKTTAALGLMLRAIGHNYKVIMLQFVKNSGANFGEHRAARQMGIEVVPRGAGFTNRGGEERQEESRRLALEQWETAKQTILSDKYRVVVLDEFTYPLKYGWIAVEDVIETLRQRPVKMHVVVTGRYAPQELIDFADIVTEMTEIKHPLKKGVKAQKGVEF